MNMSDELVQGKVQHVVERQVGASVAFDTSSGAEALYVSDASDFYDRPGDQVSINGSTYVVTGVYAMEGDEQDVVGITPPLVSAVESGVRVVILPEAIEKVAMVMVDGWQSDSVEVQVPHDLKDRIPIGIRDDSEMESVQLGMVGQQYSIVEVGSRTLTVESQYLDIDPVTEQDVEEIRQALEQAKQAAEAGINEAKQAAAEADSAAAEAHAAAGIAEQIANSKTTNYPPSTSPPAVPNGGHKIGDTWQDSTKGNLQHTWDGASWVPVSLGSKALDDFIITARKQSTTKHILY